MMCYPAGFAAPSLKVDFLLRQKGSNLSGARSNSQNYIFATSPDRVERRYSARKTRDKEKNTSSYLRVYTRAAANIFTGP